MDGSNENNGKNEVISKIVSIEWGMFTSVNEGGERASCQEDRPTFEGMRTAQFAAWPAFVRESYLDDLEEAIREKRNLVEEKYIHMMKLTDPVQYGALQHRVETPSDTKLVLAREICEKVLEQTHTLYGQYPYVSGHGRPLYSKDDRYGTSIETYQFGELLTYSERTLAGLKEHIFALEKSGGSLARTILENTVKFYGYETLDTAEKATKERLG